MGHHDKLKMGGRRKKKRKEMGRIRAITEDLAMPKEEEKNRKKKGKCRREKEIHTRPWRRRRTLWGGRRWRSCCCCWRLRACSVLLLLLVMEPRVQREVEVEWSRASGCWVRKFEKREGDGRKERKSLVSYVVSNAAVIQSQNTFNG